LIKLIENVLTFSAPFFIALGFFLLGYLIRKPIDDSKHNRLILGGIGIGISVCSFIYFVGMSLQ